MDDIANDNTMLGSSEYPSAVGDVGFDCRIILCLCSDLQIILHCED